MLSRNAIFPKASSGNTLEQFKPEIKGNSIVCGNKALLMDEAGRIVLTADGEELGRFHYHFGLNLVAESKTVYSDADNWRIFDRATSSFKQDGNKFEWVKNSVLGGKNFSLYHQSVEILSDGLIRITADALPVPENIGYHYKYFHFSPGKEIMCGKKVILNGVEAAIPNSETELTNSNIILENHSKDLNCILFADDPSKRFIISGKRPELYFIRVYYNKAMKVPQMLLGDASSKKPESTVIYLDIREGTAYRQSSDTRGDVDFRAIENLTMPDNSSRNLMVNPSFEEGFKGYKFLLIVDYLGSYMANRWNRESFAIDDKIARFGRNSLRITAPDNRIDMANSISAPPAVVQPGVYTLSYYMKSNMPRLSLQSAVRGQAGTPFIIPGSWITSSPGTDWQRVHCTFKLEKSAALCVFFSAWGDDRAGKIWLDGIQLEKGPATTEFTVKAVEGRLLTSAPDNFLSAASTEIGTRMELNGPPNASGTAEITVKNFFGEEVYREKINFKCNDEGYGSFKIAIDGKIGKGVFVIRTDYLLEDGAKCYDLHRFARVDYLENKHPLKRIFSISYAAPESTPCFPAILERYRKLGVGGKTQFKTLDKQVFDAYQAYGVEPMNNFMVTYFSSVNQHFHRFGLMRNSMGRYELTDSPSILRKYTQGLRHPKGSELVPASDVLVWDFKTENNGEITPEYLNKFQQAATIIARENPHVKLWALSGEISLKFPLNWWGAAGAEEAFIKKYVQLLGAFTKGVKEGNPLARIFQEAPSNMEPSRGIAETDALLAEAEKQGVKFDVIGIHPYRFSPEIPDLDTDTRSMLKMLDRHDYKNAPLFWTEMMHWGPYNIPQWGNRSSEWNEATWVNGALSYDIGWTEKLSAAWYARAWLVALKYADRLITAQGGTSHNNFELDYQLTPYAAQLIPNTLGNLLGDSEFRQDIRFAPFIRCYVFEDHAKRPVAALWNYSVQMDSGKEDASLAEADFSDSLEGIFDLMNTPRKFNQGKLCFPISGFPLFLRGKPGTLDKMLEALNNTRLTGGMNTLPVSASLIPVSPTHGRVTVTNLLSRSLEGSYADKQFVLPGSESIQLDYPLSTPLKANSINTFALNGNMAISGYPSSPLNLATRAFLCHKVDDRAEFSTVDWNKLPAIEMENFVGVKKEISGNFRVGWNRSGLFLEVNVKDSKFVHQELDSPLQRWANDCVQIYFDSCADGPAKQKLGISGYDDNDYEYALYPNPQGTVASIFRYHLVDGQLGLGQNAPKNHTFATDIPCSFTRTEIGYTYRIFFPEKYILPVKLQNGYVLGFGLLVPNADNPDEKSMRRRVTSALTLAPQGQGCWNTPHLWPAMLLTD